MAGNEKAGAAVSAPERRGDMEASPRFPPRKPGKQVPVVVWRGVVQDESGRTFKPGETVSVDERDLPRLVLSGHIKPVNFVEPLLQDGNLRVTPVDGPSVQAQIS